LTTACFCTAIVFATCFLTTCCFAALCLAAGVAPGRVAVAAPGVTAVRFPGVAAPEELVRVVVAGVDVPGVVVVVPVAVAPVVVVPVVVVPVVVVPGVVVVAGGVEAHCEEVIVSVSSVTAPLRASRRPSTETPVVTVMLVRASIVPTKVEPVPSVAELPICQ
jgi:hypothetical protein